MAHAYLLQPAKANPSLAFVLVQKIFNAVFPKVAEVVVVNLVEDHVEVMYALLFDRLKAMAIKDIQWSKSNKRTLSIQVPIHFHHHHQTIQ